MITAVDMYLVFVHNLVIPVQELVFVFHHAYQIARDALKDLLNNNIAKSCYQSLALPVKICS